MLERRLAGGHPKLTTTPPKSGRPMADLKPGVGIFRGVFVLGVFQVFLFASFHTTFYGFHDEACALLCVFAFRGLVCLLSSSSLHLSGQRLALTSVCLARP
ncbi:hypothetical protein V8F20_002651 [Naviculisporaceae sp. PSN 640]